MFSHIDILHNVPALVFHHLCKHLLKARLSNGVNHRHMFLSGWNSEQQQIILAVLCYVDTESIEKADKSAIS